MTFVIFCLQERGALGFMVFVSHLSHSNASVRQALPHLGYDLTVCSPITCFDAELIGPSSTSPALTFFLSHTFSTVSLLNGMLDPSMSLSSFYSLFHPSWFPDCLFPPLPLATACWIKHCWSLSQRIRRLQKKSAFPRSIQLQMALPNKSRPESDKCYTLFLLHHRRTRPHWTHVGVQCVFVTASSLTNAVGKLNKCIWLAP